MPVSPATVAHIANFDLNIVSKLRASSHLSWVFIVRNSIFWRACLEVWRIKQSLYHFFCMLVTIDTSSSCRLNRLAFALIYIHIVYVHVDVNIVIVFFLSITIIFLLGLIFF